MIPALYDTTILKKYPHERLVNELTKGYIMRPFPELQTAKGRSVKGVCFVPNHDEYRHLPTFTQPLRLTIPGKSSPVWVIDGRDFWRSDMSLLATNDWTFQCVRIILTDAALQNNVHPIRMGTLPAKVFVRWIVQTLTVRYNLDVGTQLAIGAIAGLYYYQMISAERLEKENLFHYTSHVATISGLARDQVAGLLEGVDTLYTIDDMLTEFKRVGHSTRLNELNFTGLFMVVAQSWIGVHSRENIGVALEHGPTFLAMVYSALNDRSFRKTVLARHAESVGRGSEGPSYLKYVNRLLGDYFEDGRGF